jgi:hypothetical protein
LSQPVINVTNLAIGQKTMQCHLKKFSKFEPNKSTWWKMRVMVMQTTITQFGLSSHWRTNGCHKISSIEPSWILNFLGSTSINFCMKLQRAVRLPSCNP